MMIQKGWIGLLQRAQRQGSVFHTIYSKKSLVRAISDVYTYVCLSVCVRVYVRSRKSLVRAISDVYTYVCLYVCEGVCTFKEKLS